MSGKGEGKEEVDDVEEDTDRKINVLQLSLAPPLRAQSTPHNDPR